MVIVNALMDKIWHAENLMVLIALYLYMSGKVTDPEQAIGMATMVTSFVLGRSYHKAAVVAANASLEATKMYAMSPSIIETKVEESTK